MFRILSIANIKIMKKNELCIVSEVQNISLKNKSRKLYMILNMCLVICNDKWYTTKSFIKNLK